MIYLILIALVVMIAISEWFRAFVGVMAIICLVLYMFEPISVFADNIIIPAIRDFILNLPAVNF